MTGGALVGTIAGLLIAAVFAVLAFRDLRRGILAYAALGCVPWIQVGAFSGNELLQGLYLAQVLATVLIAVWLIRKPPSLSRTLGAFPFNRWLLLLLPASVLSLFSGMAWLDGTVPLRNVKFAVSVGQILLFVWPVGVYLVAADQVRDVAWTRRFRRTVTWLALPQLLLLAWPALRPYLSWSWYFGLIASPLACAMMVESGQPLWRRVALLGLTLIPMVEGLRTGKAFLYLYVGIVIVVVLWFRFRRASLGVVFAVSLGVLVTQLVPTGVFVPAPFEELVERERRQQSWGGRGGRVAIAQDAIDIWTGHPILGVGPGNSYPYMLQYSVIGTPHSQYFGLLLELGIVGLGLFLAFVIGCIRYGVAILGARRSREERLFLLGWLASFVSWSVVSITGDYMIHSIRNGGIEMFSGFYIHWLFLGAAVGISSRDRRHRTRARVPASTASRTWAVASVQRSLH